MADFGQNLKNIWMKSMETIGNTASSIASNTRFKVDEMNLVTKRSEILKDFGAKAYALWQKGEHFPEELEKELKQLGKLDDQLNDLRAERYAGIQAKEKAEADAPDSEPEDGAPDPLGNESENPIEAAEESFGETTEAEEPAEADSAGTVTEAEKTESKEEADNGPSRENKTDEPDESANTVPVIEAETEQETPKADEPLSSAINDLFDQMPSAEQSAEKVNKALDTLQEQLKSFSDGLDDTIDQLSKKISDED